MADECIHRANKAHMVYNDSICARTRTLSTYCDTKKDEKGTCVAIVGLLGVKKWHNVIEKVMRRAHYLPKKEFLRLSRQTVRFLAFRSRSQRSTFDAPRHPCSHSGSKGQHMVD